MRSIQRRSFARSALSLFAVLGLVMTVFGSFAPAPVKAQTASLLINSHTCPGDITGLDIYGLAAACNGTDRAGFTYSAVLQGGDPALYTYTATTAADGMVGFNDLPLGTYYIYVTPPADYVGFQAYCSVSDFLGADRYSTYFPQLQPSIVDVQIAVEGDMGYCDFFNYKAAPAPTTGTVTVNKITCPEGFDGYSTDIYGLAAGCQDATQIVDFSLTDVNGVTSNATTPGSVVNLATFSGVPTGAFSITEQTLQDYGPPRVFCKNLSILGQSETSTEVTVNGTTADYEFKVGYDDVYCDWFNIAYEPGFVVVVVNKYACPEGYLSSDPSELAATCHEPYDPVTFKLDGASTGNPGDQETGSVIPNGVRWSGLEGDTYYITEFIPEGWGQPIVFCKLISNDDLSESPLEQVPVEEAEDGYRIVYDVAEFYTLSCDWYNVTETPYVGIYIHKYGCPATYDSAWAFEDWIHNCTTVVRDAHFTLEYPDGSSNQQSVNGIDLWWELLPPGEYRISEQQPAVWSGSEVFCAVGSYTGDLGSYERLEIGGNELTWDLGPYEYLDCYWYNLPTARPTITTVDPNAPATLTIVKYTCPEDYEPLATDANPEEDCDELTDGISFAVIGSEDATISGVTGDNEEGEVTFSGLKAGSYLLRETYPENTEAAFIWSCESDIRIFDYPFTPFARIDHTGTIKISVVAGETLVCSWYDVPSPPEDEATPEAGGEVDVTISVFQCSTGAVTLAACDDPVGEGVGISLSATSGEGGPIDFETDASGVATGSVPGGEYDIDADEPICLGNSEAFTPDGTLEFTEGEAAEITVGLCG